MINIKYILMLILLITPIHTREELNYHNLSEVANRNNRTSNSTFSNSNFTSIVRGTSTPSPSSSPPPSPSSSPSSFTPSEPTPYPTPYPTPIFQTPSVIGLFLFFSVIIVGFGGSMIFAMATRCIRMRKEKLEEARILIMNDDSVKIYGVNG